MAKDPKTNKHTLINTDNRMMVTRGEDGQGEDAEAKRGSNTR